MSLYKKQVHDNKNHKPVCIFTVPSLSGGTNVTPSETLTFDQLSQFGRGVSGVN